MAGIRRITFGVVVAAFLAILTVWSGCGPAGPAAAVVPGAPNVWAKYIEGVASGEECAFNADNSIAWMTLTMTQSDIEPLAEILEIEDPKFSATDNTLVTGQAVKVGDITGTAGGQAATVQLNYNLVSGSLNADSQGNVVFTYRFQVTLVGVGMRIDYDFDQTGTVDADGTTITFIERSGQATIVVTTDSGDAEQDIDIPSVSYDSSWQQTKGTPLM